jgi:hypothetical protein
MYQSFPQDASRAGVILMWKDIIEEFADVELDDDAEE